MSGGPAVPTDLLEDPRHLVPECAECERRDESGICGIDLHPAAEWRRPGGCPAYAPLAIEPGGDPDPEEFTDY